MFTRVILLLAALSLPAAAATRLPSSLTDHTRLPGCAPLSARETSGSHEEIVISPGSVQKPLLTAPGCLSQATPDPLPGNAPRIDPLPRLRPSAAWPLRLSHTAEPVQTAVPKKQPEAPAEVNRVPGRPVLWLIGDSTVNNSTKGQMGWGKPFADQLNPEKITLENRARGGRSSRSYRREGLWEEVRRSIQPGDYLLIQFGHNDGGPIDREKARASLKGNTDETRDVVIKETGEKETVHSYGWYLRTYITEARSAGATVIILSPVPRNMWKEEHVNRASADYGLWAAQAAKQEGVPFVDLNEITAQRYEADTRQKVEKEYFSPTDHTHTTPAGAAVNASCVAEGLRKQGIAAFLK